MWYGYLMVQLINSLSTQELQLRSLTTRVIRQKLDADRVEMVTLNDGRILCFDKDGFAKRRRENDRATSLLRKCDARLAIKVYGPALAFTPDMVRG